MSKQANNDKSMLRIPDTGDLECQVLADLINNPDTISQCREIINRDMFSHDEFRKVWDILNDMTDQGKTIDLSTVNPLVEPSIINAILSKDAGLYKATHDHCSALSAMATRRLVVTRAYQIMTRAGNPETSLSEVLAMPGDLANELAGQVRPGATTQTIVEVLKEGADDLEKRATGQLTRIPTGIPKLDSAIFGGWNPGHLVVLAARPSVGKSAIMLQMVVGAGRAGFPATVYSLEMPNIDLAQRLFWSTGELSQRDIANDDAIKKLDWSKVERAIKEYEGLPVSFNTRLFTMDDICNDIILQHQRGRCDIAFIDHLHIIAGDNNRLPLYQQIKERTRRFHQLAEECRIPIVVLCQLNRMSETENRPPDFRDLRDSGSIEEDANIVLMLARHTNTRADPDVDMWVRKSRNGKTDFCIELTGDFTRGFTVFKERC